MSGGNYLPESYQLSGRSKPYAFDQVGNLLWSDDGLGRTAYAYDDVGRLAAAVYPDGSCLWLGYDRAGNLAERRSPGGARDRFAYDDAGQLAAAHYADGTTITYQYDEAGRLAEAQSPGCITRYAYDEAGRPVRCQQDVAGTTYVTEFTYNGDGHLTGVRVPGFDAWLRYRYDDQQRLVALGHDGTPDLIEIEYDQAGRQVVVSYANGITQRFALDSRYQMQHIQVTLPEGEQILDLRYRAGALGNIVAINDQRFVYDAHNRLVEYGPLLGDRVQLRYDGAGNRLEVRTPGGTLRTYQYDAAGQLTGWTRPNGAKVRCGYDGEGNLAARSDGRANWSYRYDGAGRQVRVMRDGQTVAEYGYDHAGRRVLKRTATETVVTHRDPWGNLLAEMTISPLPEGEGPGPALSEVEEVRETRVYLGPAGQYLACLAIRDGQVETLFLHLDHLGSVRAVTDDQGRLVVRYDFDPFGNDQEAEGRRQSAEPRRTTNDERRTLAVGRWPLVVRPSAFSHLHIFAGHPFDPDTGWYDAGSRWYDPEVGRFVSPDTYTFAADDPRLLFSIPPLPLGEGRGEGAEARRRLRDERHRAWQGNTALRNRYVYALNNPLTYVDRDGHSAGLYFLYTLAAIFWALPYTVGGFLIFEVMLNWLTFAWLWDWGNHQWKGESSDRLSAWAWWTIGGLAGRLVIGGGAFTLGNFVIANADFLKKLNTTTQNFGISVRHNDLIATPPANLLTERQAVVEHELRHTNQYGWWGPFMMPWVLVLFFLVMNLLLQAASAIAKKDVYVHWQDIWKTLTDKWWNKVVAGVGILLLPGAYWWDYIVRGGYAASWFEQNAGQHSGSAYAQDVRASASQDSVGPNGTAIVSVITANGPLAGGLNRVPSLNLAVTTSGSGTPTVVDITPPQIVNLKVFRYTAGPNRGTDVLTASDGASNFTLEIEVR